MGSKNEPAFILSSVADVSVVGKHLASLRDLLQHCINDEPDISSLGFLAPLADRTAASYWLELMSTVTGPDATTRLLIATPPSSNKVVATVQLARIPKETHAFKSEVRKLMVHPDYRQHRLGK